MERRGLRIHPSAWLAVLLVVAALVPYTHVLEHPRSQVLHSYGMQATDATFTLRDYWATASIGSTPFTNGHDPTMGAPEGVPVSSSVQVANALQPAVIWGLKPLLGMTGAWTALLLLGVIGTALAFFFVLQRLGFSPGISFIGAYALVANPWFIQAAQAGHVGLLHEWPIALAILLLARVEQSPSLRLAVAIGATWAVSFYVFTYVGALTTIVLAAGFALLLVTAVSGADRLWLCTLASAAIGTALVLLLPALIDLLVVGVHGNPLYARNIDDFFGTSLRFFLMPAHWNPVLRHVYRAHISDEQILYPSYVLLAFAAVAIATRRRAGDLTFIGRLAGIVALCGVALALSQTWNIFGVSIPMPANWLGHATTLFDINARFGYLALIGITLLACIGLSILPSRVRRVLVPATFVILVIEFATPLLPTWDLRLPPHDAWLAQHPGGIVAYYPMFKYGGSFAAMENEEYSLQPKQGHPIFNMFPVTRPDWLGTQEFAIRALSKPLTDDTSAQVLAARGVRWVVVRDDVERAIGETPPKLPANDYRLVASFPEARIFEVIAKPTDIAAMLAVNHEQIAWAWGAPIPALRPTTGSVIPTKRPSTLAVRNGGTFEVSGLNWPQGYVFHPELLIAPPNAGLEIVDDRGTVLAHAPATTADLGPFPLPPGSTTLRMRFTRTTDETVPLRSLPTLEPYADYSRSVNG